MIPEGSSGAAAGSLARALDLRGGGGVARSIFE
jgi:hypothetical protein